jgi:multidrug efflux pump
VISRFFIDRPIFATVLSLIITILGAVTVGALPVAQYPEITPPTVQVSCSYPGANAKVLVDTVAAPIEQQVNGIEKMLYMYSISTNDGNYNLTVTFDIGTNLGLALVEVQNRVSLAMPQLPKQVQSQGITIKKKSPNIMLAINLVSPDRRYDSIYLSNYATIYLKDELFRIQGVGDITYLGQRDYSIRAWLDPDKLASLNMATNDVTDALRAQNFAVATGQVGQPPSRPDQEKQTTITTIGRLTEPEDFGEVILRTTPSGTNNPAAAVVRLRDVARLDLGAKNYDQIASLDGQPSVAICIFQLPGSNAIQTAHAVYAKMKELSAHFPEGLEYQIVYDTTPFISESIVEVVKTLRDAIILVAIVVLIFLQNWRAVLIPLLAVPVALSGTFAVMNAMGFSLNNLSLFGLVLAIGIVVDDAIVVVENVERWMSQGLSPRDAAARAMDEVTGPIVAVALVLTAVFVPCAFLSGITGQFFRQFALTIAVSTIISAFNSLTFSPAMAAVLLKPHAAKRDPLTWFFDVFLGWFFKVFNFVFDGMTGIYTRIVGLLLRLSFIVLIVYGGLLFLTYKAFTAVPTGFIPQQDKGYLLVNVQLPDSASVQRTQEVMEHVDQIARNMPGVKHTVAVAGQSILYSANSPNWGSMFVILDEFERRRSPGLQGPAINAALRQRLQAEVREAVFGVYGPAPVDGLGTAGGFKLMIEERGGGSLDDLQEETERVVFKGSKIRGIFALFSIFRSNSPQLFLDINRTKVRTHAVDLNDVFDTLQFCMGSFFVNNFNIFGRSWQVNVQADDPFRMTADQVRKLKVRNLLGEMVPLGTIVDVKDSNGPVMVMRYNMYQAAPINGAALPILSSGQVVNVLDGVTKETLPPSMTAQWTELMYLQILAGNSALYVFALAVLLVFLVLAAQYESWVLPMAVILVVPMCLLCSVIGIALSRMEMNIFTQIGFVVLVGLASKNAILIVEFAKQRRESGATHRDATLDACRLRLRPILMTSFAFILGVLPLVVAQGAGAEMRHALGTAVFSGMLGVTFFGVLLTPVFFFVIDRLSERRTH